jgi:hypothetical protein
MSPEKVADLRLAARLTVRKFERLTREEPAAPPAPVAALSALARGAVAACDEIDRLRERIARLTTPSRN